MEEKSLNDAVETSEYVPPQVERVIEADELEREVHYAGSINPVSR